MAFANESNIENAAQYSFLSIPQFKAGCRFIDSLDIKSGEKVLDIGCGTGQLTRYIAEVVGDYGEVMGVDPDAERIKLARKNTADVSNTTFEVGDSGSGFLHHNEAYFDLHFSNQVFHWLDLNEKEVYVKKAYECLKPDGLLAIRCLALPEVDDIGNLFMKCLTSKIKFVGEAEVTELLYKLGFTNVETAIIISNPHFNSFDDFAAWCLASIYANPNELSDKKMLEDFKEKIAQPNGRVSVPFKIIAITGRKQALD